MNIEQVKAQIKFDILALAPSATVDFRTGEVEDESILVYVFNVRDELVKAVRKIITNASWSLPISLTPIVKSVSVTRQYYPQYLGGSCEQDQSILITHLFGITAATWKNSVVHFGGSTFELVGILSTEWKGPQKSEARFTRGDECPKPSMTELSQCAANEELALAA